MLRLPEPVKDSDFSVEKAMENRKSVRKYREDSIKLEEISQILWSAGKSPSAGGIYPMKIYLMAGSVENIEASIYRYLPSKHELELAVEGDKRSGLCKACLNQRFVRDAPANIVITALYDKIKRGYGERGVRYAIIEAGHMSQNIYLQAEAMDLGTVAVGAFHDDHVSEVMELSPKESPLYVMPVGRR